MATVSTPRTDLSACQGKIRHPLQRLRVYIRSYIAAECLALALLFLASWFWIGLLCDYGIFALTRTVFSNWLSPSTSPLDWMETLPAVFPVLFFLFIGAMLAILAYHLFRRMIREFRDLALALLLERRFPKLLGDRLITAVELADIRAQARYGYSRPMIEQTIRDAAERVDQVPIRQVLNWRRLTLLYSLVAFMYVGMTVLFACGFVLLAPGNGAYAKFTNGWRNFTDARSIWVSRNFGLKKAYWPRQSYLEIQDYPRYRLTQDSVDTLVSKDGMPKDVAGKLTPILDRFRLSSQQLSELADTRVISREVADKLAPLAEEKEKPASEFALAVRGRLSSEENDRYGAAILNSARTKANTMPSDEFLDSVASRLTEPEYRKYSEAILKRAEKTDKRIGRDRGTAEVRVRAYKWVIATDDPGRGRYGWRPMKWSDVTPELMGTQAHLPALPSSWRLRGEFFAVLGGPNAGLLPTSLPYAALLLSEQAAAEQWTVDRVEQRLGPEDLDLDRLLAIRGFLKEAVDREKLLENRSITLRKRQPGKDGGEAGQQFVIKDDDGQWRQLLWADLADAAQPVGLEAPGLPRQWPEGMSVDAVVERMAKVELDTMVAIKEQVLDRLGTLTQEAGANGKVRALKVPHGENAVTIFYDSADTRTQNRASMTALPNNEFSVTLTDLKDDVTCSIRGEDYFTPTFPITVIPEPRLQSFSYDRYIPAYILYRMPPGQEQSLKGKRQLFAGASLFAEAGEENTIQVPAGTRLTIHGTADRPLRAAPSILSYSGQYYALPAVAALEPSDPSSFKVEVGDLNVRDYIQDGKLDRQKEYSFDLEIADLDGVKNSFHMKIVVQEDRKPSVATKVVDYIRDVKKDNDYRGYEGSKIVSIDAWVPFVGDVSDDHGLSRVDFVLTVTPIEARTDTIGQAMLTMLGMGQIGTGQGGTLRALPYMWMAYAPKTSKPGKQSAEHRIELPHFKTARRPGIRPEPGELENLLTMRFDEVLRRKLNLTKDEAPPNVLVQEDSYKLEPEPAATDRPQTGLDIRTLQDLLKDAQGRPLFRKASPREVQMRYKVQLEVEAQDTDVENGPHKAVNKETFTFLVVSEQELIGLMGHDEEEMHVDLTKGLDELRDCERATDKALTEDIRNPKGLGEFRKISDRLVKVDEGLERAKTSIMKVSDDMERILNEVRANRIAGEQLGHAEELVKLLHEVLKHDFDDCKNAVSDLHGALENELDKELASRTANSVKAGEEARAKIVQLVTKVEQISAKMQGIIGFAKLIDVLRHMMEINEKDATQLENLYKELLNKILGAEGK